jgi:hypothetical protein
MDYIKDKWIILRINGLYYGLIGCIDTVEDELIILVVIGLC